MNKILPWKFSLEKLNESNKENEKKKQFITTQKFFKVNL